MAKPGQQISHYKILEKLGGGGMGLVYKAQDLKLDRLVALKFLNKELVSNEESRIRFRNEARAISALEHPNIAVVYEIDEVDDLIFISMGYYAGETLQELLTQGPLPFNQVYDFGIQIAQGLSAAHHAGIIHRDIKPGNIIITKGNQVKILDFGLAKVTNFTAITQQDTVIGTAAYMSPEQIQGITVDHRTDIFSFASLLYEMISGQRPFPGEYGAAVAYSIINEEPTPLHDLRPETPPALETIVSKALAKDREDRYQNVIEIETELNNLLNDSTKILIHPPKRKFNLSSPNRLLALFGSMVVVAILVLLFFILRPDKMSHGQVTSIAIMPFAVESVEDDWNWLGAAVTDLLITDLSQDSTYRVLSAQKRRTIMRKLGIDDAPLSKNQAIQIAQKAKMKNILMGSLQKHQNNIQVHAQILKTDNGISHTELSSVTSDINKLYALIDKLSSNIKQLMNLNVSTDQPSRSIASLTTSSLDAYRFYLEGKDAALDQRYQEGIEKLSRAINIDSTFIKAYYYLAWQYSLVGDNLKAKEILIKGKPYISLLSEEERLDYLCNEARIDRRWKDYSNYLKHLLRINPFDANSHYLYGRTQYYIFRNLETGISAMEKSLQLDSTYNYTYNTLGYAYLSKGDKNKAMQMIEKYIQLDPAGVNPLSSKAEIQVFIGLYQQAIANCERIAVIQSDFQYAPLILAQAYCGQGRYATALQVLSDYLLSEKYPQFRSMAHTITAKIHLLRNEFQEANTFAQQAISENSNNREAHWMHARIMLQMGDKIAAVAELDELERVLSAQESLEGMWFKYHLQGEIALNDSDYTGAIDAFKKAINLGPLDRSFYLTALASAYEESQQFDLAVRQYTEALAFNPNNALANFGLARTYEKSGDILASSRAYGKVLDIWSKADETIKERMIVKNKISALKISSKQ
ncbi:MAG: protein kinase [bacterium]